MIPWRLKKWEIPSKGSKQDSAFGEKASREEDSRDISNASGSDIEAAEDFG